MEDHDERPWEEAGAVRRDCEPHRGNLLQILAVASASCGALAWLPPLIVFPIAVGIATRLMATRDLKMMRAGTMDPAGIKIAECAKRYAGIGLSTVAMCCFLGSLQFLYQELR